MLTEAAAVAVFVAELSGALGAPAPRVELARGTLPPRTIALADVEHGSVTLNALWLSSANRPWLRCVARHEAAHFILGHFPASGDTAAQHEREADALTLARWNEHDPRCDAHLR